MKKILVVDDDQDIRNTIQLLLEKNGFKPILAVDGEDCLSKLQSVRPDLILLDIMMPGLSGWDVCGRIRSDASYDAIPIFFLTGKTDTMSRSMGSKGVQDFIEKPFDVFDLLERIKKVL